MDSSTVDGKIAGERKISRSRSGLNMGREYGIGKERVEDKTSL